MSSKTPLISVILPVHNGERYLRNSIESILAQTLTDFELLISDDCSSDQSWNIIQSFSDPRIHGIRQEQNLGLFGNLNQLVKSSRASLIQIFCQDDMMEPEFLENELEFFACHPEIALSYVKANFIDGEGNFAGKTPINDLPEITPPVLSLQYFYYYDCFTGNISSMCIRKKAFDDYGLFDDSFLTAGDFEMWSRICERENLGIIHQYLIQVRTHPKQLSRRVSSLVSNIAEKKRVRTRILPQLPIEIQSYARWYVRLRQNVFAMHYAVQCALVGRLEDSFKVLRLLGIGDSGFAFLFWLLTANNRLFHPQPRFVTDANSGKP